jgi:hypothetical protein
MKENYKTQNRRVSCSQKKTLLIQLLSLDRKGFQETGHESAAHSDKDTYGLW